MENSKLSLENLFVPVRWNGNNEWFDYRKMSASRDAVNTDLDKESMQLPGYFQSNPVHRIARITITEA